MLQICDFNELENELHVLQQMVHVNKTAINCNFRCTDIVIGFLLCSARYIISFEHKSKYVLIT